MMIRLIVGGRRHLKGPRSLILRSLRMRTIRMMRMATKRKWRILAMKEILKMLIRLQNNGLRKSGPPKMIDLCTVIQILF